MPGRSDDHVATLGRIMIICLRTIPPLAAATPRPASRPPLGPPAERELHAATRPGADVRHPQPASLAPPRSAYAARVPTPQFVLDLRARIGHDPLLLPSVTAVVFADDGRVLLVRRADNGRWALVTGCLEPGEQPAAGAIREIAEETGVAASAEHLLSVSALPVMVCPNGDQVHYFDTAFRCRALSGDARVNDDESVDVGWFTPAELPDIPARHRRCIEDALSAKSAARFRVA